MNSLRGNPRKLWSVLVSVFQLTASIMHIITVSTHRYLLSGPKVKTWSYKADLSMSLVRDLISSRNPNKYAPIVDALHEWDKSKAIKSPKDGKAVQFTIPHQPVPQEYRSISGVWEQKLCALSEAQDEAGMDAECVASNVLNLTVTDSPEFLQAADGGNERVILSMHGGAYVTGSVRSSRALNVMLSEKTGLRVFGFTYRLAPEYPFPAQLHDAYSAYIYLVNKLGYKADNILLSGYSAGGNLALGLWLLLGKPSFLGLILMSPRVDVVSNRPSWSKNRGIDYIPPYDIYDPTCSVRKLLAPNGPATNEVLKLLDDPFVAPIHADLRGMPNTLIQAGTAEGMYDDIAVFAQRAVEQNSKLASPPVIDFQAYKDMPHVFQAMSWFNESDKAAEAIGVFYNSVLGRRSL